MNVRTSPALRRAVGGLGFPGLLRSSAWVLGGALISRGATLVASIVVARLIAPADFGRVSLMLTAVAILSGIAGLGLGLAITRQVAEARAVEPTLVARYLGSALTLTAAGGLAVAAVLIAGRSTAADLLLQNEELGNLVAAAACAVVFLALNMAIQGALVGFESFRPLATAQCIQGIAAGAGLVAGAATGDATGALTGFAAGQAVAAPVCAVILHRTAAAHEIVPAYRIWPRETRSLFRYGLPTFAAFLAVSGALFAAQLLLSHQENGYEEIALFNVAYRWHLAILFVPACMAPVLVPIVTRLRAESRGDDVKSIFRGTMWGTLLLSLVPALVVAAAAPLFMGLSGDFYADNPYPLVILAAAAVPAALNNVLSSTAVGVGAMRAWLASDVVLALVIVAGAAALAAALLAEGVAIAYLAGFVATDVALALPLIRRLRA